jgi:probable rRNA maturation factor
LRDLLRIETFELGLYLVGAEEMTWLNETFLRHAGTTDVITFDYGAPGPADGAFGEIFVCLDEAVRQARRFRTTWRRELTRYVVHGVLHLRGYNDHRANDRRAMKRVEDRLLRTLNAP